MESIAFSLAGLLQCVVMAGESILIVDDTPVNLKLTQLVLAGQGYAITTAPSAEAALQALDRLIPDLILADVLLPGMSGLEMTRRIRSDSRMRGIKIIALTAFAMDSDRKEAMAAGCDGYIAKPIETRSLGAQIREVLDRQTDPENDNPPKPGASPGLILSRAETAALKLQFLTEAGRECQELLNSPRAAFRLEQAQKLSHQWIGTAGTLGFTEISDLARRMAQLTEDRLATSTDIYGCLTELASAFDAQLRSMDRSIPEHIGHALREKRIALIGFTPEYAERACAPLERIGARPRLFQSSEGFECDAIQSCDLILVHVHAETKGTHWLEGEGSPGPPVVLTGTQEELLNLSPATQKRSREFLMDDWQTEELLMRLSRAASCDADPTVAAEMTEVRQAPPPEDRAHTICGKVVLADDDPLILTLVSRTLQNFGMRCLVAGNGRDALRLIREESPRVAILDVNMPELDGYEVLRSIRTENLPVRVVLLTARRRDADVLKGFGLGTDDYVAKPFNTMELAARVKRLLC
jgi:two-component system cell cycle response regulator DivK